MGVRAPINSYFTFLVTDFLKGVLGKIGKFVLFCFSSLNSNNC